MAWFTSIPIIGDLLGKITDKIAPDKGKVLEAQSRINEAEVAGAPVSRLRLWRPFVGCVLGIVLAWEIMVRPVISTYWPEAILPPSMLKEVLHLLMAMMGIGL